MLSPRQIANAFAGIGGVVRHQGIAEPRYFFPIDVSEACGTSSEPCVKRPLASATATDLKPFLTGEPPPKRRRATDSQKILVVGPSSAKIDFIKYLEKHVPETRARTAGVVTMDRMTDNKIVAEGRRYFAQDDPWSGRIVFAYAGRENDGIYAVERRDHRRDLLAHRVAKPVDGKSRVGVGRGGLVARDGLRTS